MAPRPATQPDRTRPTPTVAAFTLIELITVVAIIGILLAVVLPGASSLWSQRNEAATANMMRGLLASARSQAVRRGERGLFFFVDPVDRVQRVVFIEAEPPDDTVDGLDLCDCDPSCCDGTICDPADSQCITEVSALNRFRVVSGGLYTVPAPYRVAPAWTLETTDLGVTLWPDQLENTLFPTHSSGSDTPRYHPNFFAILFGANGELVVGRNVLIHDPDGEVTGLLVNNVAETWIIDADGPDYVDISDASNPDLYDIVVLDDDRAANFISVDGLVVYNGAETADLDGIAVGEVLRREGQPFYITRYTGDIILGPRGE